MKVFNYVAEGSQTTEGHLNIYVNYLRQSYDRGDHSRLFMDPSDIQPMGLSYKTSPTVYMAAILFDEGQLLELVA